jgi:hypothetical protein
MNRIQPVNNVEMDMIVSKILEEYSYCPSDDIFTIINENLGEKYSLDDFTTFIMDKDTFKKKFAIIFVKQNYARSYIEKIIKKESLEDLF